MKRKIILIVLAIVLLFLDINTVGVAYVAFVFGYLIYMIRNKNINEIVIAFPLFGYSFCLFVNKLTGIINLGLLLGIVSLLFGYIIISRYSKNGKLKTSVNSLIVTYSVFFLTIVFSIAFMYLEKYQLMKMQLLILWSSVFFISINSFDGSIDKFNFEEFLILSFFLFIPHFSIALDEGKTLSPFQTWTVYSILDDGIRGHEFDIITATRIAGIGLLAYFIYLLDFNAKKAYLILFFIAFAIMLVICQTRQSIVALFFPSFLFLMYVVKKDKQNYFGIIAGIMFLAFSVYNYTQYLDDNGVQSRIVSTVEGSSEEGSGREKIWETAIQFISEDRPSTGFGNFKFFTNGATYPHNIFLEIYIENGILALLSLIMIMLYIIFEIYSVFFIYKENSKLELFLIFSTVYYLGLAQFSVDLPGNLMFLYTFALFVVVKNNRKKTSTWITV